MNSKNLGKQLRKHRKEAQLTQSELAKRANITPTYLSIIERGAQLPRLETFITLANLLNISADSLLTDDSCILSKNNTNILKFDCSGLNESQINQLEETLHVLIEGYRSINNSERLPPLD